MRIMKFFGFLNLRGISGQIAALVVASVVTLHLIITASFLIHRPDQPDPSFDRGHAQLAAAAQLLGAAPAPERPRLMGDIARAFPLLGIESIAPTESPPTRSVRFTRPSRPTRGTAGLSPSDKRNRDDISSLPMPSWVTVYQPSLNDCAGPLKPQSL